MGLGLHNNLSYLFDYARRKARKGSMNKIFIRKSSTFIEKEKSAKKISNCIENIEL